MKVLVIDDDKFIRSLLVSELVQENLFAETASDGEAGFAKILEWHPDVVVLDLILPKQDGFAVLEKIKKLPPDIRGHLSVYVFSSLGQEHDRDEALALGATAYFSKNNTTVRNIIEIIRAKFLGTTPS
jgi:CheY-like chemotaxis protein